MNFVFYGAAIIAIISALLVITRRNAMHALLYLILMLLSLGLTFFVLGAPFLAILQVVVYAGAIMVLFVFVVMMLNLGPPQERQELRWLGVEVWALPTLFTMLLLILSAYALATMGSARPPVGIVAPKQVGLALYRQYVLVVEIASLILTAGLVGAFHLAPPTRRAEPPEPRPASEVPHD